MSLKGKLIDRQQKPLYFHTKHFYSKRKFHQPPFRLVMTISQPGNAESLVSPVIILGHPRPRPTVAEEVGVVKHLFYRHSGAVRFTEFPDHYRLVDAVLVIMAL